jgi:hypothetical protein
VKVEREESARVLTAAARRSASKTPDVDLETAKKLLAKINERDGIWLDYD